MKEIKLTRGMVAIVDDEDYESLSSFNWQAVLYSKNTEKYRAQRRLAGPKHVTKIIKMHRQIMNVTNSSVEVDHINGNPLDNRKSNLRICNRSENNMNRSKGSIKSTSVFKGVCWDKIRKKWICHIKTNGKNKFLGRFNCEKEAALAYNKKAMELHGEFASLNKV